MSAICHLVFPLRSTLCSFSDCNVWRRPTSLYLCAFFLPECETFIFARFSLCAKSATRQRAGAKPGMLWGDLPPRCVFDFICIVCLCVCGVPRSACVLVQSWGVWMYFFKHNVCFLSFGVHVCLPMYVCVHMIQGHSIAPHGSIPYPGHHGYQGHLSQRVPADQTGVHPDDVSPQRLLLGTFVAHNAQVLVDTGKNQQEDKTLSWCPSLNCCACLSVCVLVLGGLVWNSVSFSSSE